MEQITYISTSRSTAPSEDEVNDILRASRRNNARDGLSGLLVVGGRRFLQVLEGPRPLVDAAYRRIYADPRHFALLELNRKPIVEPSFPDWAMGYQASDDEDLVALVDRLTAPIRDDRSLRTHLLSFAQMHRRVA